MDPFVSRHPLDARSQRPPSAEKDAVELYVRTYSTSLRASGDVKLRAFVPAHLSIGSSLHAGADDPLPDAGALIYAVHRLPRSMARVERVVLGQLPEQFAAALGESIGEWEIVEAAARRRVWRHDGQHNLAIHIASPSDVDDVVPTLGAYQIEWNKLHALVQTSPQARELLAAPSGAPQDWGAGGPAPPRTPGVGERPTRRPCRRSPWPCACPPTTGSGCKPRSATSSGPRCAPSPRPRRT